LGTDKNWLFLSVPLQFLALRAAKYAFYSGKSLKTEVFRDFLMQKLIASNEYYRTLEACMNYNTAYAQPNTKVMLYIMLVYS
jgi:hypothetical protein